jgi:mRNA interferase RelE/StbE
MLKLDLTNDAKKFIEQLDAKPFRQIFKKILALLDDPEPQDTKALTGYPYRRADVGDFRIIYRFDQEVLAVILIGKRNDDEVYRKLDRK